MTNRDKYFKGQQDNETFICFMRHHWIYLIREFVYFTIFVVIVAFMVLKIDAIIDILRGDKAMKLLFATLFLTGTLFIHRVFIKVLNYFVNTGIITNIRFMDHQKSLFFKDNMDSIDMAQIQNIERIGDGLLPSLLGYGDIRIFLNASSGIKTFHCITNAKFHFRCINRQRELRQSQLSSEMGVQIDDPKFG